MMLLTAPTIEETAARIERAYLRRHPEWRLVAVPPRLWCAAAALLLDLHRGDPSLPLDPELFVASQPTSAACDPWQALTRGAAARRYRRRVEQIIRALRVELREEIRLIGRRIAQGDSAELALNSPSRSLSPLGRYVAAYRLGRPDLAAPWREQARDQHRSCPLYLRACARLIPASAYPVPEALPGPASPLARCRQAPPFSLN